MLAACGGAVDQSAAHLWSIHGRPTQGPAGPALDQLAAPIPEAAQLDVYCAEFDVPYPQIFGATVKALRERGDAVRSADSDVGLIATKRSQHWPTFTDSYATQYLIAFEKVSATRTRAIFKILRWRLTFNSTDNLQRSPIDSELSVDSRIQRDNANDFASLLHKRLR
jgi:hypothetical protein